MAAGTGTASDRSIWGMVTATLVGFAEDDPLLVQLVNVIVAFYAYYLHTRQARSTSTR